MVICYLTLLFFFGGWGGEGEDSVLSHIQASVSSHLTEFWKTELFLERKHNTV